MNKKNVLIVLLLSFSLLIFFTPVKTESYYETKEQKFTCILDTYIPFHEETNISHGYEDTWIVKSNYSVAMFKFNITNKPVNYVKCEVKLTLNTTLQSNIVCQAFPYAVKYFQWTENLTREQQLSIPLVLTNYPPNHLPFRYECDYWSSITDLYIDISDHLYVYEMCFFIWVPLGMEGVELTGFSNNYGNYNDEPSLIWTVEHDLEPEIVETLMKIPPMELILLVSAVGIVGIVIGYSSDDIRRVIQKITKRLRKKEKFSAE